MDKLVQELKEKIIATLDLVDLKSTDIGDHDPLVGGELGLDSIDVLEMVILLEKEYGVLIDSKELGVEVFQTITTLAEHVQKNRTQVSA